MRTPALRTIALLVLVLALAGCVDGVSTPTTTPPSTTPAATASPEATVPGTPTGSPSPSPEPSMPPEELDDVDGVTTDHLARMPEYLVDLHRSDSRANVDEHRAVVEYSGQAGHVKLGYAAFFVEVPDGRFVQVADRTDELYLTALHDSVEQLEADGRQVVQSQPRLGGIDWDCAETERDEEFERDMAVCRSTMYGRIISATLIVHHEPDGAELSHRVSLYLGQLGEAVLAIG